MIKKILFVIGGLAVLLIGTVAILTLAAPTEFRVEREIVINKPKAEVFSYVKILKNQNEWGPWFKKEPSMKQEFRGTDGNIGFISAWSGQTEEVGEGEQEIKKIVEGERIETELRFTRPFESKSDAYLTTEAAAENQTKVKWGMSGSMPRPMNAMLLFFDMDAAVGKDFDEGLQNLKTIMEKR